VGIVDPTSLIPSTLTADENRWSLLAMQIFIAASSLSCEWAMFGGFPGIFYQSAGRPCWVAFVMTGLLWLAKCFGRASHSGNAL